jgi:hypothetical protein
MVEQVKEIRPEIEVEALAELGGLLDGEVPARLEWRRLNSQFFTNFYALFTHRVAISAIVYERKLWGILGRSDR